MFKTPELLIPSPPVKSYFLRVEIYSGQELPGTQGMIHLQIGPYLQKSAMIKNNFGIFDWDLETLEFPRLLLPVDASQIPDLIVYFADQDFENHRKCYFRIKAPKILCRGHKRYAKLHQRPMMIKFREDPTVEGVEEDQFSGFVIMRPVLFAYEPPERIQYVKMQKSMQSYQLRLFLYVGRSLPAASEGGTCNPLVVIRVANKVLYSRIKRNTLNPEWYQVETCKIKTFDHKLKDSPPLAIVVMLYHVDDPLVKPRDLFNRKKINDSSKKKTLLGRYWLEVDLSKQKLYSNSTSGVPYILDY